VLLRDLLDVIVDGCQQVVRLHIEGRSTAQGKPPAWLERAAAFKVVGLYEGFTALVLEAPALAQVAPQRLVQSDAIETIDRERSCLDLLGESLRDAIAGRTESDAFDDRLIRTFERFSRALHHGIEVVEFGDETPIRIDAESTEALGRLRGAIPPDQHVRVAGELDVLQLSDRMFTIILASARVRGVAGHGVDLSSLGELWGQDVVVTGVAKFRPSGSILRIEAERIERANDRDLSLWSAEPRPIFGVLDERALRQPQGPRSGVSAVFGQLAGVETDEDIIEALDRLS
jgi:hypothetical protein